MYQKNLIEQDLQLYFRKIHRKGDKLAGLFILGFFVLGLLLSPLYNSWRLSLILGSTCTIVYFICYFFWSGTLFSRLIIASLYALFTIQLLMQVHGLAEMRFIIFVNMAILILYQDWKVTIPYSTFVIAPYIIILFLPQLVIFHWIHPKELLLSEFVLHVLGVFLMTTTCIWWSLAMYQRTKTNFKNIKVRDHQIVEIQKAVRFAEAISLGDLHTNFDKVTSKDILGKSLLKMRDSLLELKGREEIEQYTTIGLSDIREIINNNQNDIKKLAESVLIKIVEYLNIQQGGFFIWRGANQYKPYLELVSHYAYNFEKMFHKKIMSGEGLVGQAFITGKTIYMTNVPEDYLIIHSGLGEIKANSILIVPIKNNEDIFGVLEFSSIQTISDYKVKFVQKAAESIAIAIDSINSYENIQKLLTISQSKTDELRSQEEELRQNMEELLAIHDAMAAKQVEIEENSQRLIRNDGIMKKSYAKMKLKQEENRLQQLELEEKQSEILTQNEKLKQIQEELEVQKEFIEQQNIGLNQQNRFIKNSINSALTIQKSILPSETKMKDILNDFFIIYEPKDIVSGDFYWVDKIGDKTILIAADCTGHGVPGAFMSLISNNILEKLIIADQKEDPADLLEHLHLHILNALNQKESFNNNGLDVAIAIVEAQDSLQQKITFAGAKRPLYYISASKTDEVQIVKGSRKSIGGIQNEDACFENHTFLLPQNSMIFLNSDGFIDQNDHKRKRLGEKRVFEVLVDGFSHKAEKQKETLANLLSQQMHNTEQRDDILFMGVRI
jgi:serine phosphatase RsbU (regulator of sigma subunit)/putative methionine-R-sulfoxide reductase with GAF domain